MCLLFSRASVASENFHYGLESCNKTLAAVNPIEEYMGQDVSVVVGEQGIEAIKPMNSFPLQLANTDRQVVDTLTSRFSYSVNSPEKNSFRVDLNEESLGINKDFTRASRVHEINIRSIEDTLVVEWTQVDAEWDNYFSCTYKPEIITAKN